MNILQLCKYYPPVLGGIELVEKTITRAHKDLGDKVIIAAFSKKGGETTGEFGETIEWINEDLFFKSAPLSFTFLFKFKKLVTEHAINRIYVHLPNPYMHEVLKLFSSFLRKNKVEVVAVYHSDIVNQKVLGKIYDSYFSSAHSVYDKWLCSSQKLWDSSPVLSKLNESKKRIIPFCTEGNMQFKIRTDFKGKLLAVGRLVPYKGFDFLIQSINHTKYELHVIGDGPEYDRLQKLAGPNIFLHKKVAEEKKVELFHSCDALVVSSINRAEAYGMIIVEAFEAGLPVVASNINSGVTYLVQHEKTGLVFEIAHKEGLLKALSRIEEDKKLYQSLSSNVRTFFENSLQYEHFRESIKKI